MYNIILNFPKKSDGQVLFETVATITKCIKINSVCLTIMNEHMIKINCLYLKMNNQINCGCIHTNDQILKIFSN